jgi:predicted TPR repeat methyltransferase
MKTPDDYSISMAYSYENSKDLSTYYNDSAKDYDIFVDSVGYVLPKLVAEKVVRYLIPTDTIVDIGCGTGILGVELGLLMGDLCVHGIDLSWEMLVAAHKKKKLNGKTYYEKLYRADIKDHIFDNKYDFMVSSGTFTTGHLDGKHLSKILNFMNDNSFAVFSVKNDHFEESRFMDELMRLQDEELIQVLEVSEVDSYNNDNYSALSKIVTIKIN